MNELLRAINELREKIIKAWSLLRIDDLKKERSDLQESMALPDFWNDQGVAKSVSTRVSRLSEKIDLWEFMLRSVNDLLEVAELDKLDQSVNMRIELEGELKKLEDRYHELEFDLMMSDSYDRNDAVVAIHAGTGGTDAQDWAEMLLRMLLRFAESRGFEVELLGQTYGAEAGIKSCVFQVKGSYAYGYLKSENGVHRLVRISPFDAEKMRHTSFALVEVLPLFDDIDLHEINIDPSDLRVDTYRASGAGGQHVNKTESAIRITHEPSGIVVSCESERSQQQNKETAMRLLRSKLLQYAKAQRDDERAKLRGEYNEAAWGNQIRSYVLQPYQLVKDVRTGYETSQVQSVLDGEIIDFVEAYLRSLVGDKESV